MPKTVSGLSLKVQSIAALSQMCNICFDGTVQRECPLASLCKPVSVTSVIGLPACLQHPSVCGYDETEALRSQECLVSCRSHVPVVEATDRRNGEEPVSACKRLKRLSEGNPDKAS